MKIKPLYDRVLILPTTDEGKTQGGIVLPSTSQERPQYGVVVAVGDGENMDNDKTDLKVKIGDKILFNKYAGAEIKIDDVTHLIMRQIDIIGIVEE